MSLQEIRSGLQAVEGTVQTAQDQLMRALEFAEKAREALQGAADHSAQAEHAQAVGLFEQAEASILALRNRLDQFNPAVANYLGSLGMGGPEAEPEAPPQEPKPAPSPTARETRDDPETVEEVPRRKADTAPEEREGTRPADSNTKPAVPESTPPAHPLLPKSATVLDDPSVPEDKSISRVGFHDGIIAVNHRIPVSDSVPGEEESNIAQATVDAFNNGELTVEKPISNPIPLDATDKQILTRIGRGETSQQIAANLGLSSTEVRQDIDGRIEQLNAASRAGLVTYGIASGQVDPKNIALPLPNHVTIIGSNPVEGTGNGSQLVQATFQGGVIRLNTEIDTPYKYREGPVTRSDSNKLSIQQGNILLLSGLGLTNETIAEATGTTAGNVASQRSVIAQKLTNQGSSAARFTAEAIRRGNLEIEQYITTGAIPLSPIALEVAADTAQDIPLRETAARLHRSAGAISDHLRNSVYPLIPTEKKIRLPSLVAYSILTRQYDPVKRKIQPMY